MSGGGVHATVKRRVAELGLDTDHFTGAAWNVGDDFRPFNTNKRPLEEVLVKNSTYQSTNSLKKRLWTEGVLSKECSRCESSEWFGQINHLQLDHIDGDRSNNEVTNLRILCANCHSLTQTYCGKNHKNKQE
jgi:hypothetical protein